MVSLDTLVRVSQCLACHGDLELTGEGARCVSCKKLYRVSGEQINFLDTAIVPDSAAQPDAIIYKLKEIVKKNPTIFKIVNRTLGAYVGKSARETTAPLPKNSLIINIGAGAEVVREDVVNLDIIPYKGVRAVADVHDLPFKDGSVDAIVAESMLEHVKDPIRAVAEMHRVLKPGGLVYIVVPFIIGYHSSPGDYYRWTTSGFRELMRNFKEKELGIAVGPTNALTYILREWLAMILSFNIPALHQLWIIFFMVLFAPLNFLDYLLKHFRTATNIAHLYYFIGTK